VNFPSNFPSGPVIVVLFVGMMVAAGIYGSIVQRKRREELFELAQRLGLDFNPGHDEGIPCHFDFLKQLDKGDNRYATNVISGIFSQNT